MLTLLLRPPANACTSLTRIEEEEKARGSLPLSSQESEQCCAPADWSPLCVLTLSLSLCRRRRGGGVLGGGGGGQREAAGT